MGMKPDSTKIVQQSVTNSPRQLSLKPERCLRQVLKCRCRNRCTVWTNLWETWNFFTLFIRAPVIYSWALFSYPILKN